MAYDSSFIPFFVFGHFWRGKYYVIFVYILQGKTEKNWKEDPAIKVTKIPKTKRRKYGMNQTLILFVQTLSVILFLIIGIMMIHCKRCLCELQNRWYALWVSACCVQDCILLWFGWKNCVRESFFRRRIIQNTNNSTYIASILFPLHVH